MGMRHVNIITVMGALTSSSIGRKREEYSQQLVMELMENGNCFCAHQLGTLIFLAGAHGTSIQEKIEILFKEEEGHCYKWCQ